MKYSNLKAINWGLPLAGHKLNVTPIATTRKTNHIKCMAECGKTKECVAINLGPSQDGEKECELLDVVRHSLSNANFVVSTGWTYVGPKSKCDANPCPEGIWCIQPESEAITNALYECIDPVKAVCKPLGMESGKILDSAIKASSVYSSGFVPHHGRLNLNRGLCGWAPAYAKKDTSWIRVDLGDTTSVTGVATQGRCNSYNNHWATSYTVSYSSDDRHWEFLKESDRTKVFTGNTDRTTVVTHIFKNPIIARYIKIAPQSYASSPVLRMELYTGCF